MRIDRPCLSIIGWDQAGDHADGEDARWDASCQVEKADRRTIRRLLWGRC